MYRFFFSQKATSPIRPQFLDKNGMLWGRWYFASGKPTLLAIKYGLSRQVVFGDRFNCIEIYDLLPGICGPSRQVVSHSSGLSKQVSRYMLIWVHLILSTISHNICKWGGEGGGVSPLLTNPTNLSYLCWFWKNSHHHCTGMDPAGFFGLWDPLHPVDPRFILEEFVDILSAYASAGFSQATWNHGDI